MQQDASLLFLLLKRHLYLSLAVIQRRQAHEAPVRNDTFDWKDLKPTSGSELGIVTLE